MPVYNNQRFVAQAIKSIQNQTYPHWELIIIDDASEDQTPKILTKKKKEDSRIRLFRNTTNQHIVFCRNRGIDQAQGDYVAFLDSDDRAHPQRLEKQLHFLRTHPQYGLCGSNVQLINPQGKILGIRSFPEDHDAICEAFFFYNPILQSTAMIQRAVLNKAGGFDDTYRNAEDLDMWMRLGTFCKLRNLPEILGDYRLHQTNSIVTQQKKMIRHALRLRKKGWQKLGYPRTWKAALVYYITYMMLYLPPKVVRALFGLIRDKK